MNAPVPDRLPPAGVTVLDERALDRLRELDPTGGLGVVRRVLQAYESSLERLLVELQAARASGDLDTVSRVAHTLKSSSGSVGALALSQRCAEVETALRTGAAAAAVGNLDSLLAEGGLALAAVRAMLDA